MRCNVNLRKSLLPLIASSLMGCASTSGMPPTVEKVLPQENCLVAAESLPELQSNSLEAMVKNHLEVAAAYWRLAERQQCLADFFK